MNELIGPRARRVLLCAALSAVPLHDALAVTQAPPSPGGLWAGTIIYADGTSAPISGEIDENGQGYLVDAHYRIYSTASAATVDGSGAISMSLNQFVPVSGDSGASQQVSPVAFTGTLVKRSSLTGILSAASTSTLSLSYVPAYELPSSTTAIAGTYRYAVPRNGALDPVTLSLASDGSLSGTSGSGCNYAGTASVVKTRYNAYALDFSVDCAGSIAQLHGTAAYVPAIAGSKGYASPPVLILEYDDGTSAALFVTAAGTVAAP